MGKVIAVSLQKGGVGKTTTCVNIAAILAEKKKKVLVVDFDGQGNASLGFGIIPEDYIGKSILEVLTGEIKIEDAIIHTEYEVDIIPANDYLSGLTITVIQDMGKKYKEPMKLLKKYLDTIKDKYDYVFIDMPPELGFFTVNALAAADEVLIPLQCEARAARGVSALLTTIKQTRDAYNHNLKILGIVATMYNRNTNLSTTVYEQAKDMFKGSPIKLFNTVIYRTVKFGEADLFNKPAVLYSNNEAIQGYRDLVKEVFNIG